MNRSEMRSQAFKQGFTDMIKLAGATSELFNIAKDFIGNMTAKRSSSIYDLLPTGMKSILSHNKNFIDSIGGRLGSGARNFTMNNREFKTMHSISKSLQKEYAKGYNPINADVAKQERALKEFRQGGLYHSELNNRISRYGHGLGVLKTDIPAAVGAVKKKMPKWVAPVAIGAGGAYVLGHRNRGYY